MSTPKGRPKNPVPAWPLFLIAAPAAVAVWSGWVGLAGLCGFGVIHPLPGIAPSVQLNTAITLPIGVEAYGAYALRAWLVGNLQDKANEFARWSAIGSLALGMAGQVIFHLLVAAHATRAPWPVVVLVSCLPVVAIGLGATLAHLLSEAREHAGTSDESDHEPLGLDAVLAARRAVGLGAVPAVPGSAPAPVPEGRCTVKVGHALGELCWRPHPCPVHPPEPVPVLDIDPVPAVISNGHAPQGPAVTGNGEFKRIRSAPVPPAVRDQSPAAGVHPVPEDVPVGSASTPADTPVPPELAAIFAALDAVPAEPGSAPAGVPVPGPEAHPEPAVSNGHDPDLEPFRDCIAEGIAPPIRTIRADLHCGQQRAARVQSRILAVIAARRQREVSVAVSDETEGNT